MSDSRFEKLSSFVQWAQSHITGDEKGQAQIFLDRLFQAFGHPGSLLPPALHRQHGLVNSARLPAGETELSLIA